MQLHATACMHMRFLHFKMEDTVHSMSVEDFASFLHDRFDEDVIDVMKKNKIAGTTFLKLSERQIEKMIPAIGDVVELMEMQARINSPRDQVYDY